MQSKAPWVQFNPDCSPRETAQINPLWHSPLYPYKEHREFSNSCSHRGCCDLAGRTEPVSPWINFHTWMNTQCYLCTVYFKNQVQFQYGPHYTKATLMFSTEYAGSFCCSVFWDGRIASIMVRLEWGILEDCKMAFHKYLNVWLLIRALANFSALVWSELIFWTCEESWQAFACPVFSYQIRR